MLKNNHYDARYHGFESASQYKDLLIPFDFYDKFENETTELLRDYISKYCNDKKEIVVLEIGFGTGLTTQRILKIDPRIRVVAIDNEEKFVKIAETSFAKLSDCNGRCKFVHSDALSYLKGIENETLDVVISVYTIHNFLPEYRYEVFELISKKLKRGGALINGDKYARDEVLHKIDFKSEIANHDKFDAKIAAAEKSGCIEEVNYWKKLKIEGIGHAHKDDLIKISVQEMDKIFTELNFANIEWGNRYHLVTTVSAMKK